MPSYRKSAQVDMTHGSVLGRAALFALPICAGNILQLLYSTVDTLVIGNFCDTTALASVATSSQPLEILLCVFVGIGSGISIPVSYTHLTLDHDQLQKLVRTSVWLLFAASLPLTVIGFLLGPWMLRLMQVPADAMPGAVLYLRITMLGILGNMGYNFNAGLLRGTGNSSSSLLLLFISCAANIVLDLVLTGALTSFCRCCTTCRGRFLWRDARWRARSAGWPTSRSPRFRRRPRCLRGKTSAHRATAVCAGAAGCSRRPRGCSPSQAGC